MEKRVLQVLLFVCAVVGLAFAWSSASDFTAHLDRQVHGIHCSFLPGSTPDVSGSSGCYVTLMSPYSSILRDTVWGGIPVALPAMAVFSYLAVLALGLLLAGRQDDRRALAYQSAAWALPFLTSMVFGYLAFTQLDAACKLCIGIYVSSTVGLFFSVVALVRTPRATIGTAIDRGSETTRDKRSPRIVDARPAARDVQPIALDTTTNDDVDRTLEEVSVLGGGFGRAAETIDESAATVDEPPRLATASEMDRRLRAGRVRGEREFVGAAPISFATLGIAFVVGVLFVVIPVGAYAAGAPDFSRFVGACGTLAHPEAADGEILVAVGPQDRPVSMLEVLDPLCPSCRGFERRFSAHEAANRVSRRVLLFPLDNECNWMVDRALHPGACVVSRAVLCAERDAESVLEWAFEHQEEIREATSRDPNAAAQMVRGRFPALADCIGSARTAALLNRSLRFAIANQLPVLTPQVYVANQRICDEDTDLGLDYVLARLLDISNRPSGGAQ